MNTKICCYIGLECEGGNVTLLGYNHWVGSYDNDKKELKSFYDISIYNHSSTQHDTIIVALCPPKYCCQSISGCDYLPNYNQYYDINTSSQSPEQWNYDSVGAADGDSRTIGWDQYLQLQFEAVSQSSLCATGRDLSVPLCGACLEGFAELLGSTRCGPNCRDESAMSLMLMIFILTALFAWYILFYDSKPSHYSSTISRKDLMAKDDYTGLTTILFKPILYYFQSLYPIINTRGISLWLSPVLAFFNFNLDFAAGNDNNENPDLCWSRGLDATGEILLNLVLPIFLFINLILPRLFINKQGYGSICCYFCCREKKCCWPCCKKYQVPYFGVGFFRVLLTTIGVVLSVCFKYLTVKNLCISDDSSNSFSFLPCILVCRDWR